MHSSRETLENLLSSLTSSQTLWGNVNRSMNYRNPKFGDKTVNKHSHSHNNSTPGFYLSVLPFCIFLIVLNNNSLPFTPFRVVNVHSKQTASALNYNERGRGRWTGISGLETEQSIRYTVSPRGQRVLYNKLYSEGLSSPPPRFNNQHLHLLDWSHKLSLQTSRAADPLQSFWTSASTPTDERRRGSLQDAHKQMDCTWPSF